MGGRAAGLPPPPPASADSATHDARSSALSRLPRSATTAVAVSAFRLAAAVAAATRPSAAAALSGVPVREMTPGAARCAAYMGRTTVL